MIAVYDWRLGRVEVLEAGDDYVVALEPAEWDYRVLAPVLPGGIAVFGDPALYACAGDARVADVVVEGEAVVVTLLGAGEHVRIVGWSRHAIRAHAWSPAAGRSEVEVTHDAVAGMWE